MITIDQLLESVDLDFEPRWVTKDKNGMIKIFEHKPEKAGYYWLDEHPLYGKAHISFIKLSEFDGKDWAECIYEVPRKVDYTKWIGKLCWFSQIRGYNRHLGILKKISDSGLYVTDDAGLHYAHCEPVRPDDDVIYKDAVNELKEKNNG
jgi:hypothetical protein